MFNGGICGKSVGDLLAKSKRNNLFFKNIYDSSVVV